MQENKLRSLVHQLLVCLPLLCGLVAATNGQTIDEFSKVPTPLAPSLPPAMPQPPIPPLPEAMPPPAQPPLQPPPQPAAVRAPAPTGPTLLHVSLIGIFSSNHKTEAEFEVNKTTRHLIVGDTLLGNWRVEKISRSSVVLTQCDQHNTCERKTLVVGAQ